MSGGEREVNEVEHGGIRTPKGGSEASPKVYDCVFGHEPLIKSIMQVL